MISDRMEWIDPEVKEAILSIEKNLRRLANKPG